MKDKPFVVESVEEKERSRNPPAPFTTSTLQQTANQRMGFTSKRTMSTAQRLYEGIELGERGTTALITYMRTDSVRIADEARTAAAEFIDGRFGNVWYCAIDSISADNAATPLHIVPVPRLDDSGIMLIGQAKPLPARPSRACCKAVVVD